MDLQIRGVSKTYPNGVQALKDVTLTIPAGMFGLLGPDGAGKSTLMRILATLEEADAGRVTLGDLDVLRQKDEVRTTLGYLPQELGIHPNVSAEKLLEPFGVTVAPLGHPKLLIVDEPTAGLAQAERLRFLNLLSELARNRVVLLSTPFAEDVSGLCTRIAILDEGCVLLETEPRRAIDALWGRIWSRVISKEALPRVQREYAVISTDLVEGYPVVRVYSNTAPAVGFERADPNLEDVYLSALAGYLRPAEDGRQRGAGQGRQRASA